MAPDGADPDDDEDAVRPEDLDFTDDRRVAELDDHKYVVATAGNDAPSTETEDAEASTEPTDRTDGESVGSRGRPDVAAARQAMVEYAERSDGRHGFVVVGSFDGDVDGTETFTDDLPAVFREFVNWYAANVDAKTPPAEVLGILLLTADVPVRYPERAVREALSAHDLSEDDPIGDLLAVAGDDGLCLPPTTDE